MLKTDVVVNRPRRYCDDALPNIGAINMDVISLIQKDLEPYDVTSLVFLLYDTPETALQRLTLLQRLSKDADSHNLNMLYDWAVREQSKPSWRYQFLEALTICQLNRVIKKLGFHFDSVKTYFNSEEFHFRTFNNCYVDPMKRILYKICENMLNNDLLRLKKTLITYGVDTTEHESCELVLLELMCQKFINIGQYSVDKKKIDGEIDMEKLINILEHFNGFSEFVTELRMLENIVKKRDLKQPNIETIQPSVSTEEIKEKTDSSKQDDSGFDEIYEMLTKMNKKYESVDNFKVDTKKLGTDAYVIKNKKRIGVCYVINQEKFNISKDSIERKIEPLEDRLGSSQDKNALINTMTALNFEVISHDNLDYNKMITCIKDIIQYRVHHDDSVFMLCILSHGVRGHVYASDGIKVKVEAIQAILDSDEARNLRGLPKVLILQACQINDDPQPELVTDSPLTNYHLRKSDFLIYWATVPEFVAYRHETKGSIFIQMLCSILKKNANAEHLYDIFTKVTDCVTHICSKLKCDQVPIFKSTLRKKLYLQIPE